MVAGGGGGGALGEGHDAVSVAVVGADNSTRGESGGRGALTLR